jgi:hypothetical protein
VDIFVVQEVADPTTLPILKYAPKRLQYLDNCTLVDSKSLINCCNLVQM